MRRTRPSPTCQGAAPPFLRPGGGRGCIHPRSIGPRPGRKKSPPPCFREAACGGVRRRICGRQGRAPSRTCQGQLSPPCERRKPFSRNGLRHSGVRRPAVRGSSRVSRRAVGRCTGSVGCAPKSTVSRHQRASSSPPGGRNRRRFVSFVSFISFVSCVSNGGRVKRMKRIRAPEHVHAWSFYRPAPRRRGAAAAQFRLCCGPPSARITAEASPTPRRRAAGRSSRNALGVPPRLRAVAPYRRPRYSWLMRTPPAPSSPAPLPASPPACWPTARPRP
jgi:hypothetical protein